MQHRSQAPRVWAGMACAAAMVAATTAEHFGPMSETAPETRPNMIRRVRSAIGWGNTSTPAPAPNITTITTTTATTTTTTLAPMTYVHFAFYENQAGASQSTKKSAQLDNSDCGLVNEHDAAYFATLRDTNCSCHKMPGQPADQDTEAAAFWYQFSMDPSSGDIKTLRAFCPMGCAVNSCRVERGLQVNSTTDADAVTCVDAGTTKPDYIDIKVDQCDSSSGVEPPASAKYQGMGSWTIRNPALNKDDHSFDICVLHNETTAADDADDLITTLFMPAGSCNVTSHEWDSDKDSVLAYTSRLVQGECTQIFPGTAQQLTINQSTGSISGHVDCECAVDTACGCHPVDDHCALAPGGYDTCTTDDSAGPMYGQHVVVVKTTDIGSDSAVFLGACKGVAPPAPPRPTPSPPDPSPSPSKKDNTVVIGAAVGVVAVVVLLVVAFFICKKRKSKRMAAYSALQDDPTF